MKILSKNDSYGLDPFTLKNSCPSQNSDMILQEAENRYRSFFKNMELGYYEIDLSGKFLFLNEFVCEIIGYTKEELHEIKHKKYIDKENKEIVFHAFSDVFKTGKPKKGCVFQIIRKDGVKRQIDISICLMKDISGNKTGFMGIAGDISEQKIMEAHKSHAGKLESIGRLAAGIAHEINTPIQYIADNTRFLQDSFSEIETILKLYNNLSEALKLGNIKESATYEIDKLIDQIDLDYLKEEIPKAIGQSLEGLGIVAKILSAMKQFSHPGTYEKIYTDINTAIQNTIIISKNEWKYVADLITEFDSSLPMIPCLPSELHQVILNLIINAAHAVADSINKKSGEKGLIKVKTCRNDSWAEILISDTGPGIPKEIRDRIFDPFFTTKEVGKGSGQGLAICHSVIVEKHGGYIGFETEVDKGTTIIVRLPINN